MPERLPVVSGSETARAFESLGWRFARQRSSHLIYVRAGRDVSLSIPDHREVAKGTLRKLIRIAEITVEEFVAALR